MAERKPLLSSSYGERAGHEDAEHGSTSTLISSSCHEVTQNGVDDGPKAKMITIKTLTATFCFFVSGILNSAPGALIGVMERHYGITDSAIGMIFPAAIAGYVCAGLLLRSAVVRQGWRAVAFLAPFTWFISTAILSTAPVFSLVLVAQFVWGLGLGFSDIGLNAWASKQPFVNIVEGFIHGGYSVGCLTGPLLVATIVKFGYGWYIFYRLMFVLNISNFIVCVAAFRHESALAYRKNFALSDAEQTRGGSAFREPAVLVCSIFLFFQISLENSITDWGIEYLKRERHFDLTTASLTSSTLWAGEAVGRLTLGFMIETFGLVKSVTVYIVLSAGFEAIFRFVHGVPSSLTLIGLIGVFYGPIFASAVVLLSRKVPSEICVSAVSIALCMGQIGGAFTPAVIGFFSDSFGMGHFPDLLLGLSAALLIMWFTFARTGEVITG